MESDPTFNPGAGPEDIATPFPLISALALQPDGRILIAGSFSFFNRSARPGLARLHADGSLDESFAPSGLPPRPLTALAVAPDDSVYVGGGPYTEWNKAHGNAVRLKADGSLDQTFAPVFAGSGDVPSGPLRMITAIAVQPDGKVLVAGYFEEVNGSPRASFARLNSDGTVDPEFNLGAPRSQSRRVGRVFFAAIQSDSKILIGGSFVEINGIPLRGIARLLPSSPAPNTIGFARSPWSAAERDGSIEITVLRRGASDRAASVDFTTRPGNATPGVDYIETSGHLEFAPLEVEKVIRIPIKDDETPEPDESLQVVFDHLSPGTRNSTAPAQVRIVDNERPGVSISGLTRDRSTALPPGGTMGPRRLKRWRSDPTGPSILEATSTTSRVSPNRASRG